MCYPGLYLILSGGFFMAQARLYNDFRWQNIFLREGPAVFRGNDK